MTCVVGLSHKGKLYLGADCLGSTSHGDKLRRIDKKVFRNNDILIGISGSFRVRDLLMYADIPKIEYPLDKYMRTTFVNFIRQLFEKVDGDFSLIIGIEGKLYTVYSDYQVEESRFPFMSIGSGCQTALGTLYSLHKMKSKLHPKKKIKLALDAAAEFTTTVSAPHVFLESK